MNLQGGSDSESESDDESDFESDDESDDEEDLATTAPQTLHHKRGIVLPETKIRLALNGTSRVNLQGLNGMFEVDLPRKCLYALNWPVDRLVALLDAKTSHILTLRTLSVENTKREDIAFIAFQIWLLGMSLVALLNESIPHMWVQLFGTQWLSEAHLYAVSRHCLRTFLRLHGVASKLWV